MQRVGLAVFAVTWTGFASSALGQLATPNACATAYHAALGELAAKRGDDLGNAVSVLKAGDAAMPGRWLYSQALFPNSKRLLPAPVERPCAERVKVAGRFRCIRWEGGAEPEPPAELTITPQPSAEELRVLRALNDLVEARGGVPEVGSNGRYTWLALRATADLKAYVTQPAHPALCSGGKEFAEFYATTMKPLKKRIDDVGELAGRARALAMGRVREVAAFAQTAASATTAEGAGKSIEGAPSADAAVQVLVVEAVRPVLSAEALGQIGHETTALAALRRAKGALIAAQVASAGGDDPKTREGVLAAGRAVRMLEAAAYGEMFVARYAKFTRDVLEVPGAVQKVHAGACTCAE